MLYQGSQSSQRVVDLAKLGLSLVCSILTVWFCDMVHLSFPLPETELGRQASGLPAYRGGGRF